MYGVMTPQHLHRLGLVNDSILYVNNSGSFGKRSTIKHYQIDENEGIRTEEDQLLKTKDEINYDEAFKTKSFLNDRYEDVEAVFKSPKTNDDLNQDKTFIQKETADDNFSDDTEYFKTIESNDAPIDESETGIFELENELTTDEILLLKQALNKIPQIPFALVLDEYRWKYFEGALDRGSFNKEFWELSYELQGIVPPEERGEEYFDIGAKFHVPDNTPYIR